MSNNTDRIFPIKSIGEANALGKALDFDKTVHEIEANMGVSSQELGTLQERLAQFAGVAYKRLMYGEWLTDECEECKTPVNVHLYRQKGISPKRTVHLCDTCFAEATPYGAYVREWEPGDK